MDKFFIQNAFKSLDEIEEEMKSNKKNLTEDLQKEDLEDLDLDDLADNYVGKIFNFEDQPVQIIKLVDYQNNFESSTWGVVTSEGVNFDVKGKDLTASKQQSLDEKLPRDLASAYRRVTKGTPAMKRKAGETQFEADLDRSLYFPGSMNRGAVSIDFENSNYIDISKEDRKKIIKDYKDRKYKLRLLFDVIGSPVVIMWDKDGDFITSPRDLPYMVSDSSPLHGISSNAAHSFNKLINAADKIYVTDEDEHKIVRNSVPEYDADAREIDNLRKKMNGDTCYPWQSPDPEYLLNSEASKYLCGARYVKAHQDTGRHQKGLAKDRADLTWRISRYNRLKREAEKNPGAASNNKLRQALEDLKYYQYLYNSRKRGDSVNRDFPTINYDLLRFKLLRMIRKHIVSAYNNADAAADVNNTRYRQALEKKKRLDETIDYLQKKLSLAVAELKQLDPDLSDEAKQEYIEAKNDYIDHLFDDATKYLDELDKYTNKLVKNKETVKESLDNCILRIYTRSRDGAEDFVDGFDTEEEAKIKYNNLVASNMYEQVCLVELCNGDVEILMDSQKPADENLDEEIADKRSIGAIVDDKLKKEDLEKDILNESKAFNLKDENDVVNANVYKTVGDEYQDELVVVDPSVESRGKEYQPHIGDAILQCKSCKISIFKNVNDLVKDEKSDIYNIDMDCPHCGAKTGFIYIGQVATKDAGVDVKDENPEEEIKAGGDEGNNSLPEAEDDFVEINDLDDIKEESFEKLVNPYLTKLYENIRGFKTTNIEQTGRDSIKIEGELVSKTGKEKLVEFLFKTKENKANSIVFEGGNKILTDQENAFKLRGNVKNKELIFESFEYNYNKEIDGDQVLIEGIEK